MTERVVGEVPGSPGRLRFLHALIRDTLYEELTPARRMQLHQRAGTALEAVYAADAEPHLAELAQHFVAAGARDKAVEYARRAGDRAISQLAYEEAVRHYRLLNPYGDRVAVSYPEISLGAVERYLGLLATTMERWDDAARHFDRALELNARIGARPWVAHTRHDYARMLLARAWPGDGDRARELHAYARAGFRELGMGVPTAPVPDRG